LSSERSGRWLSSERNGRWLSSERSERVETEAGARGCLGFVTGLAALLNQRRPLGLAALLNQRLPLGLAALLNQRRGRVARSAP
jgi:hypothetical protein